MSNSTALGSSSFIDEYNSLEKELETEEKITRCLEAFGGCKSVKN